MLLASRPRAIGRSTQRDKAATAGIDRPIVASGAEAEVEAGLKPVGQSGPDGGDPFRQKDQRGDDDSDDGPGRSERGDPGLDGRRQGLGEKDDGAEAGEQKHGRDRRLRFDGGSAWTSSSAASVFGGRK